MKKFTKIKKPNSEKEGTNIQVVLRCRGRNIQEIEANSPVIVEPVSSSRQRDVLIKTTNKVYSFDHVFGPESNQEEIYYEVAQPILDQVLLGYNCTIFAYGQTGSGKTYTMEGDLSDRTIGSNSKAGIIPRVIYKLFESLDYQGAEYSVKVSLIELYNEELRDLLSVGGNNGPLRIYEDHQGSGVIVQNIEETLISNAEDGLRVLQEGTRNRSSAATKCNEKSSRSHCIFTLTVHIKELVTGGEEVLKVGKLNLVDLAGSENISRSGAENTRAREAGMINQSLLTLGRVINQLVDHSPHVPYRESKLTRLLKDSLGGRTKTCIVATVSIAKLSQEEIVSTLDYASRAKNIRNTPEANQRLNPKILLREYESTIERLKADLTASRTQKGVYLSQETYNMIMDEKQSKTDRVDELSRDIDTLRTSLEERAAELAEMTKLMETKELKLASTKMKLYDLDSKLKHQLQEFQQQMTLYTIDVESTIEQHFESVDKSTDTMNSLATQGINNQKELTSKIDKIRQQFYDEIKAQNKKAKDQMHHYFKSMDKEIHDFGNRLGQLGQFFTQDIRRHISEEEAYLTSQQQWVETLGNDTLSKVTKELATLNEQHELLQAFVEQEHGRRKEEDTKMTEMVSQYLAQMMDKYSHERSCRLNNIMGDVREQLNQSGDQLRSFQHQIKSVLSSNLDKNALRIQQVQNFSGKTLLQQDLLGKIQKSISHHGETSSINHQYLQKHVNENGSVVDKTCQSLATEISNSSQKLESMISTITSSTIDIKFEPSSTTTIEPIVTTNTLENQKEDKVEDDVPRILLQDISNRQGKIYIYL
ncbi:P-loop containing nucleoside triphosphate hydrolase protein [Halteromyces radiatus]|uniref:P-loop containing nucleoside triphosphate hydrolase protein n=1 Tax=Halteromyces radiatus TaxID=101107 RepID=UPI00221EE002|nr:P-loop containing nucleoside triphosphate hydrolase protein [Halteromyces radiatus]KAI8097253.1 P-loop containing nucleoside triphosphate hydrolase protein [Halteromyces radiatus]